MAKINQQLASPEELEKFDDFLVQMDDVLEMFVTDAKNAGFELNYSFDSLDTVEKFFLAHADVATNSQLQNRVARYVGEVFRKHIGGKWELCLKGPNYLYHKRPVLTGYSVKPIEFCPIDVVANVAVKKESGLLRRAVESHMRFKA